jgi:polysaccharide export outer membrane protein
LTVERPHGAIAAGTIACIGELVIMTRHLAVLVIGFVVMAACAGNAHAQSVTATAANPPAYVLQRGDEITVKVFEQPELNDNVVVRPDGRISVVLLDDVEASGLTVAELDAQLTAGYAKFFNAPQVSVIVRRFANHRIFVGGEVGAPGAVPIVGDMRALEAVLHAGGFRPTARLDSVVLLRNDGNDRAVVQKLNFKEILEKGGDVALKPFDVIFVPMSRIAKVDKFIDQYVRQLLPISLTAGFTYIMGDSVVLPK